MRASEIKTGTGVKPILVNVPADLYDRVKGAAHERGLSLRALIQSLLERWLRSGK